VPVVVVAVPVLAPSLVLALERVSRQLAPSLVLALERVSRQLAPSSVMALERMSRQLAPSLVLALERMSRQELALSERQLVSKDPTANMHRMLEAGATTSHLHRSRRCFVRCPEALALLTR
jgi:hypothetical protein